MSEYNPLAFLTITSSPPGGVGIGAPITYGVGFYRKDYTGPRLVLDYAAGVPLLIEAHNEADNLFSPLIAQILTLGLIVDNTYDEKLFAVTTDYDVKVEVDALTSTGAIASRVFWGWLASPELQVEYAPKPYPLTLKVQCGLAHLKARPMLGSDGRLVDHQLSLREALNAALNMATRLTLPLCTVDNLQEAYARRTTTLDSQLDMTTRLYLGADYFTSGGENGNPPTAKAIVADICNALNATLTQHGASWWLVRIPEKAGGWLPRNETANTDNRGKVLARTLDYDGTNPQTSLIDLRYPVSLAGSGRMLLGATQTTQAAKASYSVKQKFGTPLNRFKNPTFAAKTTDQYLPDNWTREGGDAGQVYRLGNGSPADPYRIRIMGSGSNKITVKSGQPYCIGFKQFVPFTNPNGQPSYELFDPHATPPRNQPLHLTGQFKGQNIRGAKLFVMAVLNPRLSPQNGGDWALLTSDNKWAVYPSANNVQGIPIEGTITTGPNTRATKPGWVDIDITIPAPGPLYVAGLWVFFAQGNELLRFPDTNSPERLNNYPTDGEWIEYTFPRITVGDAEKAITGQVFTVTNFTVVDPGVAPTTPDVDLTINFGDLPPVMTVGPPLSGMLRTSVFTGEFPPAGRVNRPAVTSEYSYLPVTYDRPLALNCALERAAQLSRPAQLLEGELAGDLPYGPLTVLQVMDLMTLLGAPMLFTLIGWTWNLRMHTTKIVARELLDYPLPPAKILAEWDTPNGRYPQEVQPPVGIVIDPLILLDPLPVVPKKTIGKYTTSELGDLASGTKDGFDLNANGGVVSLTPVQKRAAGLLTLQRNGYTIDQVGPIGRPLTEYVDPTTNG